MGSRRTGSSVGSEEEGVVLVPATGPLGLASPGKKKQAANHLSRQLAALKRSESDQQRHFAEQRGSAGERRGDGAESEAGGRGPDDASSVATSAADDEGVCLGDLSDSPTKSNVMRPTVLRQSDILEKKRFAPRKDMPPSSMIYQAMKRR